MADKWREQSLANISRYSDVIKKAAADNGVSSTEIAGIMAKEKESSVTAEEPIAILKPNITWVLAGQAILGCLVIYGLLFVILPVLVSGEYASVVGKGSIYKKIYLFYLFLLGVPVWFFSFFLTFRRFADLYFFTDHLEYVAKSGNKKIIPYNTMHVVKKNRYLNITMEVDPGWSRPFRHLKIKYLDGIGFGIIFEEPRIAGMQAGVTRYWQNPADGMKVLAILKEKAYSFK